MSGSKQNEKDDLAKYAKAASEALFKDKKKSDFDEDKLASGSKDLLDKSDAERFPDELEEYTLEERRPRIVKKKDK